ncbi:MAG: hypothetical protein Q4G59_00970 [Planctomycetia bacterium]|nr:hypothetical protein [Planctomycetia bacterium]
MIVPLWASDITDEFDEDVTVLLVEKINPTQWQLIDSLDQPFIIDLTCIGGVGVQDMQRLVQNPFLRGVMLAEITNLVSDLEVLSSAPQLELLVLPFAMHEALEKLSNFPALEVLDIAGYATSPETEGMFASLVRLTGLKRLAFFAGETVDDVMFQQIAALDKLESLTLKSAPLLSGNGLSVLKQLPCLTELILNCVDSEQLDAICEQLGELPTLRRLALINISGLTDHNLQQLSRLTGLEILTLDLAGPPENVTTEGIRYLSSLTSLKELELYSLCNLPDQAMEPLVNLFRLEKLTIDAAWRLTDVGVNTLTQIRSLELLDLAGIGRVTDEGLAALSQLPNLRSLLLQGSKLTDTGLENMVNSTRLERLVLLQCKKITGQGVKQLTYAKTLESLAILQCWRVRKNDIDELRTNMPYCRILWSGCPGSLFSLVFNVSFIGLTCGIIGLALYLFIKAICFVVVTITGLFAAGGWITT